MKQPGLNAPTNRQNDCLHSLCSLPGSRLCGRACLDAPCDSPIGLKPSSPFCVPAERVAVRRLPDVQGWPAQMGLARQDGGGNSRVFGPFPSFLFHHVRPRALWHTLPFCCRLGTLMLAGTHAGKGPGTKVRPFVPPLLIAHG